MATVLVIEDDEAIRNIICSFLRKLGLTVYDTDDGASGIELYDQYKNDLVITDIFMANKSGLQVIKELKEYSPKPKIIAMSGAGEGTLRLEGLLHLGADKYLKKPFQLKELTDLVNDLIEVG